MSPDFSEIQRGGVIIYSALGDSLTYGYGSTHPCTTINPPPLGKPIPSPVPASVCAGKTSFVDVLVQKLSKYYPTTVQNLGIPGASLSAVVTEELPLLNPNATLVTLYIGTNDTYWWAYNLKAISDFTTSWEAGYKSLINQIKQAAPKAKIVLLNVPNQGLMPAASTTKAPVSNLNKISIAMNNIINPLSITYPLVDNVCNTNSYQAAFLEDGLHPNDQGYALLAAKVFDTITSPASIAPIPTCAPYLTPTF